ncbi:MAG: acetate--CoA ligase family protein [Syntrophales bacterium]|nr:acetate--CoA ligase family protein [Syntrophales bacterium]
MERKNLDAVFRPKSVALIGASATPGKLGYDILYNIIHGGFQGPIYPINPKAETILDLKVYRDIASPPEPPELAVIVIPAKMVPQAIEDCGKAGVKAAIVITGGFAEAGPEGEKLQEDLANLAHKYGISVIGPNCQGVNHPHHNLCASWPLITTKGRMTFVSQSGTVGAALIDWASEEHLGVSCFVSLGNRADIDETDCIQYFNEDPNTKVIALYIEGVKRPEKFRESLARTTKPIVILKAGRTARGKIAAESHTKSLAGDDEIYTALFEKYRIHRADTLEELYDFAKALAYMEKPKGRKLLCISSSGGAAILAIDEGERLGFESPPPSPALKKQLRSFLPPHCGVTNPIDLTGDAITDPTLYSKVIEAAKGHYDTSVVIFGDPIHGASEIVTGKDELIVFCGGADVEREESKKMHEKGIPVFPTPERAIKALYQFFRFDEKKKKREEHVTRPSSLRLLPYTETAGLLKKYEIPIVPAYEAKTATEAINIARGIGGPVAMKIDSPDISHKTDVGGVKLNLGKSSEIKKAYEEMISEVKGKAPHARISGVTISPMAEPGGVEVIVGVVKDPQYGHALMFGLGGIFTEIYRDVKFCLLPAKESEFRHMIENIKGHPILSGFRGQKPRDIKALIALMKNLSQLVRHHPEIDQIDLNPVLLYEKGALVVDYRIYTG